MRGEEGELTGRATKLWVKDNMPMLAKEEYIRPEPRELIEGGYFDRVENELSHSPRKVAREMWLRANSEIISELGLHVCLKKELKMLEKKARRCEEVERENARLRNELAWMREQVAGLPTRKYRVLKPIGILQKGLVIETFNIPWAEELVRQGFLEAYPCKNVEKKDFGRGAGLVSVEQYCHSLDETVVLGVNGEVRGRLVEGNVEKCSRGQCSKPGFCWVGRRILTSLTPP